MLAALVVALGFSLQAFAGTFVVGTCSSAGFPNIKTAVKSAPAGSTIEICPGTYAEQVLIQKNLTLTGIASNGDTGSSASGANNPVITTPSGGLVANASDLNGSGPIAAQIAVVSPTSTPIVVNLYNLVIDGSNNQIAGCSPDPVGIYYQNANGTVKEVVTRYQELSGGLFGCQSGLGIFVESGYGSGGSATVTIENSGVHDYQKNGITVDGSATIATISGNYVVGIGATSLIAQNGIQVSDGAAGEVEKNTVTDDVYINPPDCSPSCYGSSGILLYDSGGASGSPITITGNTVSNTQLAIVAYSDGLAPADYNNVTSNKITGTVAAGPYLDDGIDLCSNNNTATSNTVYNSSGSGVHIDSTCTEPSGTSGNNTTVTKNTINEACAGVLTGSGSGSSQSGNIFYNVVQTVQSGDSCPAGSAGTAETKAKARLKPLPRQH
jgi:hypothetical protein